MNINKLLLDTGRVAWIIQELGYANPKIIADYYLKGFGDDISPNTLNIILEKLKIKIILVFLLEQISCQIICLKKQCLEP